MSGFNKSKEKRNVGVTFEGGVAYSKDIVSDWINNLFSNNLEDKFYQKSDENLDEFESLTTEIRSQFGDAFVAKLAEFARNEIGMRSVSQAVAAMLNDSKMEGKREFYRNFCHRPDDCAEIFAYLDSKGEKRSHAMVRGFGDYLSKLSEYQLGKYKMIGKSWNMYDLVNVTHATSPAIDLLKKDMLKAPDTWEVSISGSQNEYEKGKNWIRLVEEHKLGYSALLMNLRNILTYAPSSEWVRKVLCPQITNEKAINQSLMFPYKIYNAYINYKNDCINGKKLISSIDVDYALARAFRLSCGLVPSFEGKTAIIVDVSGSMSSPYSNKSNLTIAEVSACYAIPLLLNGSDTTAYKFGTHASEFKYSRIGNPFDLIEDLKRNDCLGYGTNLDSVYKIMDKKYDRIIIFSDMQVMSTDNWASADAVFKHDEYCRKYGDCPVFSFDLGDYRYQGVTSRKDIYCFTTVSSYVFRFISLLESGQSIADYIMNNY